MNRNLAIKSQLDTRELLLLESEMKNRGKSMVIAYLLWYFLGAWGGHRFYMGRKGSAIAMLILFFTIIGTVAVLIWWIVDAFKLHQWVNEENEWLESRLLTEIQSRSTQGNVYNE